MSFRETHLPFTDGTLTPVWRGSWEDSPEDERTARYWVTPPGAPADPYAALEALYPGAGPFSFTRGRWKGADGVSGFLAARATSWYEGHSRAEELPGVFAGGAPLWRGRWARREPGRSELETLFYATNPNGLYLRALELAEGCDAGSASSSDWLTAESPDGRAYSTRVYARRAVAGWFQDPGKNDWAIRVAVPRRNLFAGRHTHPAARIGDSTQLVELALVGGWVEGLVTTHFLRFMGEGPPAGLKPGTRVLLSWGCGTEVEGVLEGRWEFPAPVADLTVF